MDKRRRRRRRKGRESSQTEAEAPSSACRCVRTWQEKDEGRADHEVQWPKGAQNRQREEDEMRQRGI